MDSLNCWVAKAKYSNQNRIRYLGIYVCHFLLFWKDNKSKEEYTVIKQSMPICWYFGEKREKQKQSPYDILAYCGMF